MGVVMTLRGIALILFALLAAVATAVFARQWIAEQQAAFNARPVPKVEKTASINVLVAKETMEAGRFVRAEDLKWVAWPKDGIADGYIIQKAEPQAGATTVKSGKSTFDGAVVRSRITAGEPVTALRLVQPGERGFLAAVLEPGRRAVSLPVDATTGISGFIFPGDWVDVIFTGHIKLDVRAEGSEGSRAKRVDFSETLLSGVQVIAMDQKVETGDGKAKVAKTATLQVSPKQAERIALALKMGGLSLSLHSLARRDRFSDLARSVGADPGRPEKTGSYTLEYELLEALKDKRFGPAVGKAGIAVLRADKAERVRF